MAETLQPGAQIRPIISVEQARQLVEKLYGIQVLSIIELEAYDDKNYHIKVTNVVSAHFQ